MKYFVLFLSILLTCSLFSACASRKLPEPPSMGPPAEKPEETPSQASAQPGEVPTQLEVPKPLEEPRLQPRKAAPGDVASLKLVESGIKQMNLGNWEDAAQFFEQALRVSPNNGKPYYYLGVLAFKQKNYDRSLGFLEQAEIYLRAEEFWMSQVLLQEGLALKALRNSDAAKAKFQEALRLDPSNKWAEKELIQMQ